MYCEVLINYLLKADVHCHYFPGAAKYVNNDCIKHISFHILCSARELLLINFGTVLMPMEHQRVLHCFPDQ